MLRCECCQKSGQAVAYAPVPSRLWVMCGKCVREVHVSLEATSWWLAEVADHRKAQAAGDHVRALLLEVKMANYFGAGVEGRAAAIQQQREIVQAAGRVS